MRFYETANRTVGVSSRPKITFVRLRSRHFLSPMTSAEHQPINVKPALRFGCVCCHLAAAAALLTPDSVEAHCAHARTDRFAKFSDPLTAVFIRSVISRSKSNAHLYFVFCPRSTSFRNMTDSRNFYSMYERIELNRHHRRHGAWRMINQSFIAVWMLQRTQCAHRSKEVPPPKNERERIRRLLPHP